MKKYDEVFNPEIFEKIGINQDEENKKINEQIEKENKDNESK